MARRRKTHVQQELRWHNAAGDLRGRKREAVRGAAGAGTRGAAGAATRGAAGAGTRGARGASNRRGKPKLGRPRKPGAKQSHVKRPVFASERVVHVTLRAERSIGKLRTRGCYAAIREAAVTVLPHEDCRIVQLSIQSTHVHLLVEADSSHALSRGMQAFQISAAKHINAAISRAGSWWERRRWRVARGRAGSERLAAGERSTAAARSAAAAQKLPKRRKGRVFADRYHARMVTSPRQARHEIAYVLNNWRKHGEDRRVVARGWRIDPFSTGWGFLGWREHEHAQWAWSRPPTYEPIPVYGPRSWLLREGWKRYGLIGMREVPSAGRAARG